MTAPEEVLMEIFDIRKNPKPKIIGSIIGAILGLASLQTQGGDSSKFMKSEDYFNPVGFTKADPMSPQSIMKMR